MRGIMKITTPNGDTLQIDLSALNHFLEEYLLEGHVKREFSGKWRVEME